MMRPAAEVSVRAAVDLRSGGSHVTVDRIGDAYERKLTFETMFFSWIAKITSAKRWSA